MVKKDITVIIAAIALLLFLLIMGINLEKSIQF
jgi:hypothetical protein